MSSSYKDTVSKVNAAFAASDVEGFLALCHDDVEWMMVGDRTVQGKQAIREWMGPMMKEPARVTPIRDIAEGNVVTELGEMTMNENGTDTLYMYCDIYRFAGDKIAELTSFVIKSDRTK